MAGNSSCSVIGDSYQGVADSVYFPSREIESVFSDAAFSHSPFLIVPFSELSSSVFHLVFLCIERSRQSIWIAFEKQSECQLTEQTGRTKPQDGTIESAQSQVMLRGHLLHQPSILIMGPLRVESERGHFTRISFLFDKSIPSRIYPLDPQI